MNVVTPESASSSETLFGGEKDYAAMHDMICVHSVASRVADRALAGIDRGARCRSARTTGLVPAL